MTGLRRISRPLRAVLTTARRPPSSGRRRLFRNPTRAATQTRPVVGDDCAGPVEGAGQVTFTDAHGGKLLSHISDGDIYGWMGYARQLAAGGYRVIMYYFHGYGTSLGGADGSTLDGDVTAAAGYLRAQGVRTVALVGAPGSDVRDALDKVLKQRDPAST
jgi:pimeloyl-ACP methyl ester carboxylesterase